MRPGRTVIAGPVEATALGNIAMQMLATGAVGVARRGARRHRSIVSGRAVRAARRRSMGRAVPAISATTWSSPVPDDDRDRHEVPATTSGTSARPRALAGESARAAALPIEPARRRSAHHQLRRRQHQLEVRAARSADRRAACACMAVKGSGGDLRSIGAIGLRPPVSRQARSADRALPRRSARRRDGRLLPAVRVRREPRRRVDRHAAARVPAVRARRSPASRLGDRAGGERQRRAEARRSSTRATAGSIVWVPWQRPGFELALMLRRAVEATARAATASCSAATASSRGATTQRDCYLNSITTIDQMGEFVEEHARRRAGRAFGGAGRDRRRRIARRPSPRSCPYLRGAVSSNRRVIAHFDDVGRRARRSPTRRGPTSCAGWARAVRITSCARASRRCSCRGIPRARTSPRSAAAHRRARRAVPRRLRGVLHGVRRAGLAGAARQQPVGGRDSRPRRVRLRQGQARGADHDGVLRQRDSRDGRRDRARRRRRTRRRRCRRHAGPSRRRTFTSFHNYVALPRLGGVPHRVLGARGGQAAADAGRDASSAARSSSWSAAAAASAARSRSQIARRGGHVVVADQNAAGAEATRAEAREAVVGGDGHGGGARPDRRARASRAALRATVLPFGGFDIVDQHRGDLSDARVRRRRAEDGLGAGRCSINVTSNYVLAQEAATVLKAQKLPASMVLTSSANAVVPKSGQRGRTTSARRRSTT